MNEQKQPIKKINAKGRNKNLQMQYSQNLNDKFVGTIKPC